MSQTLYAIPLPCLPHAGMADLLSPADIFSYPCAALGKDCTVYASLIDSMRATLKDLHYERRYSWHDYSPSSVAKSVRKVYEHGSWSHLHDPIILATNLTGDNYLSEII